MERDQHHTLYALMRRWGATHEQAVDMLDGATFGPGLVGIQTQGSSFGPAVGIRSTRPSTASSASCWPGAPNSGCR